MPSPTFVALTTAQHNDSTATTHPVPLPVGIAAGEAILIQFVSRNGAAVTWDQATAGTWHLVDDSIEDSGAVRLTTFSKIADGSEAGLTLNIQTSVGSRCVWSILRATNVDTITAGTARTDQGSTGSPNPPLVTPAGGSAATLWVTSFASRDGQTHGISDVAGPSGYNANKEYIQTSTVGGRVSIGTSWRTATAATEDPAAWSIDISLRCVAQTFAMRFSGNTISLPLLSPTSALFAPELTPIVSLPLLGPGSIVFEPAMQYDQTIDFPLIPSGAIVYSPIIVEKELGLSFIPSGAVLFEPTIVPGAATIALPLLQANVKLPRHLVTGGDRTPPTFAHVEIGAAASVMADLAFYTGATEGAAFALRWDARGPIGFGDFAPFVPGEYEFSEAFVQLTIEVEPVERVFAITRAKINVDVPDVIDSQEVDIPEGGAWVTFTRNFYQIPNVVAQVIAAADVTTAPRATVTAKEATRAFVVLHFGDDLTDSIAARANVIASGY